MCNSGYEGLSCQVDAGKKRIVNLGCRIQPLPTHITDVCYGALKSCAGYQNSRLGDSDVRYNLCNKTCPLLEMGSCSPATKYDPCKKGAGIICQTLVSGSSCTRGGHGGGAWSRGVVAGRMRTAANLSVCSRGSHG